MKYLLQKDIRPCKLLAIYTKELLDICGGSNDIQHCDERNFLKMIRLILFQTLRYSVRLLRTSRKN